MTARNMNRPIPVEDIIRYIRTTKKEVSNVYKALQKCNIFPKFDSRLKPTDMVAKACKKLTVGLKAQMQAQIICDNFREYGICEGRRPNTIAGAAIMIALHLEFC